MPVFIISSINNMFIVFTDAYLLSLGGVLLQKCQVVAYISRTQKSHELNYHTYNLEFSVVVFTLMIWRQYLYRVLLSYIQIITA